MELSNLIFKDLGEILFRIFKVVFFFLLEYCTFLTNKIMYLVNKQF